MYPLNMQLPAPKIGFAVANDEDEHKSLTATGYGPAYVAPPAPAAPAAPAAPKTPPEPAVIAEDPVKEPVAITKGSKTKASE